MNKVLVRTVPINRDGRNQMQDGHRLILVVEDDDEMNRMYETVFNCEVAPQLGEAISVMIAHDLEEGESMAERFIKAIDLIIMDGKLHGRFTPPLIRTIRHRLHFCGPIEGCTGELDPAFLAEMSAAGCNSILHKPFGFDDFMDSVLAFLRPPPAHAAAAMH